MRSYHNVILSPVITEKATGQKSENRYVFKVADSATKIDIRTAVEKIFTVKVADVNTVRVKGKVRGAIRGRIGMTSGWKKAYVTLKEGQKIAALEA